MKIGILTFHRARNYGAFLQSISLCSRLNMENGIEAEVIDYDMLKGHNAYRISPFSKKYLRHFGNFFFDVKMKKAFDRGYEKTKKLRSEETLVSDSLEEFQNFVKNKYDVIIAGSDEIWNLNHLRGFAKPYFLIGDLGCRKFSYAASSRSKFDMLNEKDHALLRQALDEFEFISVRDEMTYNEIKSAGIPEEKMTVSCDPSLLYHFDVAKRDIAELTKGQSIDKNKKNILVLCENRQVKRKIKEQLGNEYNLISSAIRTDGYINVPDLDPFEWMEMINSVDLVVSSFFHGICYSIMNNTPFIAIASSESRRSKLDGLLSGTELEYRFIDHKDIGNVSWREMAEKFTENVDFSKFVEARREGFDRYLERLKANNE